MTRLRPIAAALAVCVSVAVLSAQRATPPAPSRPPTIPQQPTPPRLLVLLVVDQFRADYAELYGSQWTQGLKRIFAEGASFPLAAMPFGVTKTCAGHSSISSGTVPGVHGMIDNEWYDTGTHEYVACTSDPSAISLPFGGERGSEHHSPRWLQTSTLADELRRQAKQPPTIVALALKARSAVSLAGHGGANTIVAWEEDSGTWATSSAFTRTPWPQVEAYVRGHPARASRGAVWNRLLPLASYLFDDRAPGEINSSVFPRRIDAPLGGSFSAVWDASPWSDAYLGDLAVTLTRSLGLGKEGRTDMLAMSFTALDYVGHNFGPRSHEVQDTLARLDGTIGQLLTALDTQVGRDHYVLALTSDHGVAPLPEQGAATGVPGGRVSVASLGRAVELALSAELGRGSYVEAIASPYIYFHPQVVDRIRSSPKAMATVGKIVQAVPGIDRLYWAAELAATSPTADPILTSLRRSYFAGRSGDVVFVTKPYWVVADIGTNHGSPRDYDTRVPLVLFGASIKPGRYAVAATPVDIVPTLASLSGVAMPRTDGRVLSEAIAK
jgi:predicted AlkP superfamily pyrophosphatase or phosphodiesterase